MNIKISKKDLDVVLEALYVCWDMSVGDLQDKEAQEYARVRDGLIEQLQNLNK